MEAPLIIAARIRRDHSSLEMFNASQVCPSKAATPAVAGADKLVYPPGAGESSSGLGLPSHEGPKLVRDDGRPRLLLEPEVIAYSAVPGYAMDLI